MGEVRDRADAGLARASLGGRGGSSDQGGSALVQLRGITKAFPGVLANDHVDLDLYRGEVHCLLGENGAGKSTLMHILAGVLAPDAGSITVDGRRLKPGSSREAVGAGIGMVYQHSVLVPTLTVVENLLLGAGGVRLDRKEAARSCAQLAESLGVDLDPDAVVGRLPLGRRQQVEIIKALWRGSRVLILDEPTAMLTPHEADRLMEVLASLREQGLAVVLITHKLREALAVADRVTVLRAGRVAGRLGPESMQGADRQKLHEELVDLMFGEGAAAATELAELRLEEQPDRAARPLAAEVVLELEEVTVRPGPEETGLEAVSFFVRQGEIFGLAGIEGNGQRELAETLAGQRRVSRGRILLGGKDVTRFGVAERQRLGLGYVTDDRLGEGLVADLPVSLNLVLKRIGSPPFWTKTGRLSRKALEQAAQSLVEEFDIRVPEVSVKGRTLSGGNIQKLLLARELSSQPKVVVYNKPTHGLDLRTTLAVRRKVRELAEGAGVAAVLISTDLDELAELSDRIGVLSAGRLVGVVENTGPGVARRVGELMVAGSGEVSARRRR